MVPTVPGAILVVLAVVAAVIVAAVTWAVPHWVLRPLPEYPARPTAATEVCLDCGTPLSAGMCPRCVKKLA